MLSLALAAIAIMLIIQRQLASAAGPHPSARVPAAARLRSPILIAGRGGDLTAVPVDSGTVSLVFGSGPTRASTYDLDSSGQDQVRPIAAELSRLDLSATFL